MYLNLHLFCSSGVLKLFLWKPGLSQRLCHLWVTAQGSVFQVLLDHDQEGGASYRLTPVLRSVCLLPDIQMGDISLGSLGGWCQISQLP